MKTASSFFFSLHSVAWRLRVFSGGSSTPPRAAASSSTSAPATPGPTFEERLADLAEHDSNPCRARTPGLRGVRWMAEE